ncbi:unnamed protein product, partial [Closterium sp. NIES-53]
MFRSAPTAIVAAPGGPSSSRAAYYSRATVFPARIHSTQFLRTGSARNFPSKSPSTHRLAVSAASRAIEASGESEPSVSAKIREIGEEETGGNLRGRPAAGRRGDAARAGADLALRHLPAPLCFMLQAESGANDSLQLQQVDQQQQAFAALPSVAASPVPLPLLSFCVDNEMFRCSCSHSKFCGHRDRLS